MKLLAIYCLSLLNLNISGQSGEQKYDQAKAYENDYRYKKAIKLYSEAISLEPSNSNYYLDRGLLYLKLERIEEAKFDLQTVVSLNAQSVKGWHGMGEYYLYKQMPDSAIYCINRSISYDWDNELTNSNLMARGDAYMLKEKFPDAYEDYMVIVKKDSANTRVLRNLAFTLHNMERDKECIHYLKKITMNNPGDIESLINVGYTMTQIGMFQESLEFFNTVLEYDDDQPYALSNRAFAYYKQGYDSEALKDIKNSLANDSKNSYAYWVRGLIEIKKGNTAKGCKDLKRAEKFDFDELNRDNIQDAVDEHCQSK